MVIIVEAGDGDLVTVGSGFCSSPTSSVDRRSVSMAEASNSGATVGGTQGTVPVGELLGPLAGNIRGTVEMVGDVDSPVVRVIWGTRVVEGR